MNNNYLNKPLYPQSEYSQNSNTNNNQKQFNSTGISSLFGNLSALFGGQNGSANPLLSMLLGMKGGNTSISSLLSKVGEGNPLFQALSTFQNSNKNDIKKESDSSPKPISSDEILF